MHILIQERLERQGRNKFPVIELYFPLPCFLVFPQCVLELYLCGKGIKELYLDPPLN